MLKLFALLCSPAGRNRSCLKIIPHHNLKSVLFFTLMLFPLFGHTEPDNQVMSLYLWDTYALCALIGALTLTLFTSLIHSIMLNDARLAYLSGFVAITAALIMLSWNVTTHNSWHFNQAPLRQTLFSAGLLFQLLLLFHFAPYSGTSKVWPRLMHLGMITTASVACITPLLDADTSLITLKFSLALFSVLCMGQMLKLFKQDAPYFIYLCITQVSNLILISTFWVYDILNHQNSAIYHIALLSGLLLNSALLAYAFIQQYVRRAQERLREHYQHTRERHLKKQYSETLRRIDSELRTPISGVIGVAELLLDTRLNKHQQDHILTIRRAGDKLMKWLNRLNDWRALQLGRLSIDSIPFDFSTLINKLSDDLKAKAQDRKINFQFNPNCELPALVKGDPARIKQILSGMLEMALHYSEQGTITLTVEPTPFKNRWKLTVTDSQSGLQKEDLNFNRTNAEIDNLLDTSSNEHSVYGHYYESQQRNWLIAQELAHKLGGYLRAVIEDGQVSYHCELNLIRHALLQHSEHVYDELLYQKRVLVVDDSTSSRKVIAKRASNWGMKVTALPNAADALALLRSIEKLGSAFDVIIFDQDTQGINALAFAQTIMNETQLQPKPVLIMLSGMYSEPESSSSRQHGISRLLSKPIDARTLKITLAEELTVAQARQVQAASLESHPPSNASASLLSISATDTVISGSDLDQAG